MIPWNSQSPVLEPRHVRGTEDAELVFESAQIEKFADSLMKNNGMAIATTWVEEGDHTYSALDALVSGFADIDESGEIDGKDEEDLYNALFDATGEALVSLGANAKDVEAFIDDESDALGKKIGGAIADTMDEEVLEDAEIIAKYAISPDGMITESSAIFEAYKRVVRDGKVVLKKKRVGHKKRMSSKQRAALKKARRKATTGAAKRHRAKSNRIRKQRGM